jgi:ribosomal protein S18 acetylase RimI-like enzyme
MKCLYVAPQGRNLGLGRLLASAIVAAANQAGYTSIRLDTLPSMATARSLYAALGFKDIEAYHVSPLEGTIFMELDVQSNWIKSRCNSVV